MGVFPASALEVVESMHCAKATGHGSERGAGFQPPPWSSGFVPEDLGLHRGCIFLICKGYQASVPGPPKVYYFWKYLAFEKNVAEWHMKQASIVFTFSEIIICLTVFLIIKSNNFIPAKKPH